MPRHIVNTQRPGLLVFGALLLVVLASRATAATPLVQPLRADDAAAVSRIAIVSLLGDGISGMYRGLGPFDRRYLHAPSVWRIDPELEQLLAGRIESSGGFDHELARVLELDDVERVLSGHRRRPIDVPALIEVARRQGFDTLLAVLPQQHPEHGDIPAGVSFELRRMRSGTRTRVCAAVVLRLYRLSDGAMIASAEPNPCLRWTESLPWHADWREYADGEAEVLLESLRRQSRLVTLESLAAIGLRSGFRPGHRTGR